MMATGRKPTPVALKLLRGNPGRRPIPSNPEPPKFTTTPQAPAHLSDAARAEWDRLAGPLIEIGLITTADVACFAAYCESFARWSEAEIQLRQQGTIVKSANGFPIQSPYLSVINSALKQMHVYAAELGLTPSSRSRVTKEAPAKADPFADFLKKSGKKKA